MLQSVQDTTCVRRLVLVLKVLAGEARKLRAVKGYDNNNNNNNNNNNGVAFSSHARLIMEDLKNCSPSMPPPPFF